MKTLVDQVREKGAKPVLVTPTSRRAFDKNGHIINTHGEYIDAIRFLAKHDSIPLIELNPMTAKLYEAMGEFKESICTLSSRNIPRTRQSTCRQYPLQSIWSLRSGPLRCRGNTLTIARTCHTYNRHTHIQSGHSRRSYNILLAVVTVRKCRKTAWQLIHK